MANQYKNLAEFNAYKDRISEYIAQELAKFPTYLRVIQKSLSGLAYIPPTDAEINSEDWYPVWFEDYDINKQGSSNGRIDLQDQVRWANFNRPDIAADVVQIINGNKEIPPRHPSHNLRYMQKEGGWFQKTLKDGKVFQGRNTDEIMVVFDDEFSSQPDDVFIIDYIAYKLAGNEPQQVLQVKLLEQNVSGFEWLPFPMPYVEINNFEKVILAPDAFRRIFSSEAWVSLNPELSNYFTDNGIDAEGALSQIESDLAQLGFKPFVQDSYKLWDNTSQFLPVGVRRRPVARPILEDIEDTDISELLPGDLQEKIDNFFDTWNNLKEFIPIGYTSTIGYNVISNGDFGGGIGPGTFIGSIDNENVTQDIIVKENPGYSPYVLRTSSNSNHYYNIEFSNPAFVPNQTITFSCWACKGEGFTANLNKLFARTFEFVYESGFSSTIVVDDNNSIMPTQNLATWTENADELTWRRYQNTFVIPENPNPEEQLNKVIITWRLNSLQSVPDNQNNNNITFKFITGLRTEIGDVVNGANFINLTSNNPKTHFQIAKDIQDLTLNGQVPIFSSSTMRNFVDGLKVSGILEELYNELITAVQGTLPGILETSNNTTTELATNFQIALTSLNEGLKAEPNNHSHESITSAITNMIQAINDLEAYYTGTIKLGIDDLIQEVKKIKQWVSAMEELDSSLFKLDNNGDGFDDVSYEAGFLAGANSVTPLVDSDGDTYDDPSFDAGSTAGYQEGYTAGRLQGHVDIFGCTNPSAENYDPAATFNDGSCVFGDPNPGGGYQGPESDLGTPDEDKAPGDGGDPPPIGGS